MMITEGGNITLNNFTADRIDFDQVDRHNMIVIIENFFKFINKNIKIWNKNLTQYYNGSSSYFFNKDISIKDAKRRTSGDIDIIVPKTRKDEFVKYIDSITNKKLKIKDVTYEIVGHNGGNRAGSQLNSILKISSNMYNLNVQIDFEFLDTDSDNIPSQFAKFSHSSSIDDNIKGIKAVHHKYILRALFQTTSVQPDCIEVTKSSTPENIKPVSGAKALKPVTFLKFSVDKGVRSAYEFLTDHAGNVCLYNGKRCVKEIESSKSHYITDLGEISFMLFGNKNVSGDIWSTVSIIKLVKKVFDKQFIDAFILNYSELLFGHGAQKLSRSSEEDIEIKFAGFNYVVNELNIPTNFSQSILKKYELI